MLDEKDDSSGGGSADDSVGHGEWRGITSEGSDVPALDAQDTTDPDSVEDSTATEEPVDELEPDDVAHDLSAELGLGYRDYGVGSQPVDEDE